MKHWLNEGKQILSAYRALRKARKQSREVSKQKSKKQNKKNPTS